MKKYALSAPALMLAFQVAAQSWTGSMVMHIDNPMRNQAVNISLYIFPEKNCMKIQTDPKAASVRIITDKKKNTMTFLAEKEGSRKVGLIHEIKEQPDIAPPEEQGVRLQVTDDSKEIRNFHCRKIIAQSPDQVTEMWVTDDTLLNYPDILKIIHNPMAPASGYAHRMKHIKDLNSFPIEMKITPVNKPEDVTTISFSQIVRGKPDERVLDTEGFEMFDMRKGADHH